MNDARQRLLEQKFGDLLDWRKPELVETIGPYDPSAFDDFEALLARAIEFARKRLESYSDAEIDVLSDPLSRDLRSLQTDWKGILYEAFGRKSQEPPSWCAGGLGHPDYRADFGYWSKMPSFSIEEIVCLSVGVAPEKFEKRLTGLTAIYDRSKLLPAETFVLKRHDLIVRRFDIRVLSEDFIEWAEQVELEMPADFRERLLAYRYPSPQSPAVTNASSEPDKREIDKIAQLLTALAIDGYGYVPDAARSPIPSQITDIVAQLGLDISVDTVRKYLKRGAAFLPKDWKPE